MGLSYLEEHKEAYAKALEAIEEAKQNLKGAGTFIASEETKEGFSSFNLELVNDESEMLRRNSAIVGAGDRNHPQGPPRIIHVGGPGGRFTIGHVPNGGFTLGGFLINMPQENPEVTEVSMDEDGEIVRGLINNITGEIIDDPAELADMGIDADDAEEIARLNHASTEIVRRVRQRAAALNQVIIEERAAQEAAAEQERFRAQLRETVKRNQEEAVERRRARAREKRDWEPDNWRR